MVTKRQCSFCAQEIEPGTGTLFVKRDGTVFQFCSSSCRKQQLHLGRIGHRFKWTRAYALKKAAERSSAERGAAGPARSRAPRPAPAAPAAAVAAPAGAVAAETSPPPARPAKPRTKAPAKAGAKSGAKTSGKGTTSAPSADS